MLGFSKQAFYQWRKDPVPQRDWDEAQLINAAVEVHADDPEWKFTADAPDGRQDASKRPTRTLMHDVEGSSKTRGVEPRGLEPLTSALQRRRSTR